MPHIRLIYIKKNIQQFFLPLFFKLVFHSLYSFHFIKRAIYERLSVIFGIISSWQKPIFSATPPRLPIHLKKYYYRRLLWNKQFHSEGKSHAITDGGVVFFFGFQKYIRRAITTYRYIIIITLIKVVFKPLSASLFVFVVIGLVIFDVEIVVVPS